ncbi:hypothetical protein M5689_009502 [Euphorbia peplus]|nr:hypothetical protein M5689_009502 [Euphorbia peplus]
MMIIIIHDTFCGAVVQDAASIENAERYVFNGIPAFTTFFALWEAIGKASQSHLKVALCCFTFEMMNFMARQNDFQKYKAGDLYNTCRLMDRTYVGLISKLENNINDDRQKKKK